MLNLKVCKRSVRLLAVSLLLSVTACSYAAPTGNALPSGFNGIVGANTPVVDGNIMDIKQDDKIKVGFIKWDSFSIGKDAVVNILQNSNQQTMINQVVGKSMSEIYGKLNAKGNVVLINPKGAVFGNGCQVNVGGLAVYAADTKVDKDFNLIAVVNNSVSSDVKIEDGASIVISQGLASLGFKSEDYKLPKAGYGEGRLILVATNDVAVNTKNSNITVGDEKNLGDIFLLSNSDLGGFGDVKVNGVVVKRNEIWQQDGIKGNIKSQKGTTSSHEENFVSSLPEFREASSEDAIPFVPETKPETNKEISLSELMDILDLEVLVLVDDAIGSTQAESNSDEDDEDSETIAMGSDAAKRVEMVKSDVLYKSVMKKIRNTPRLNKF